MEPVVTRDINRTCPMPHDPQFCRKWFLVLLRNVHFGSKYLKLRTSFLIFFFYFREKHAYVPANLKALRAANTNPANFVLHEITLIVVKGFFPKIWYPFERLGLSIRKNIAIRSNSYGYPFEKEMSSL